MNNRPRFLGDLNGDGLDDIIGFKNDAIYYSLNTGTDFLPTSKYAADGIFVSDGGTYIE